MPSTYQLTFRHGYFCMASCLLALMMLSEVRAQTENENQMNILFIVIDDLRPQINALLDPENPPFIHPKMVTPNLDGLARRSLVLTNAHVQQPWCSPSRTSALTGRRPGTTHVFDLNTYWREVGGNFTTIPQYFKERGYESLGMGKIFHWSDNPDSLSWTWEFYRDPEFPWHEKMDLSWQAVPEEVWEKLPLPDMLVRNRAVDSLKYLAKNVTDKPFFMAVGFHKPHLPFTFPEEFLEVYGDNDIRLPDNPYAPVGMPPVAWHNYDLLRRYEDIAALNATGDINTTLPDSVTLDLRRAYCASVTYVDSMVGEVLDALDDLGYSSNTIIAMWGDHGYSLGEHGHWDKKTNFELSTHAPLMIHIPGLTEGGMKSDELVEMVDIFPTLVEAAGFPALDLCPENSTDIPVCTEGTSLMPLISRSAPPDWKQAAFTQQLALEEEYDGFMGYSIRTHHYRYTEWVEFEGPPGYGPIWDRVAGIELYDRAMDPWENVNKAGYPEYEEVQRSLQSRLHLGWRYE